MTVPFFNPRLQRMDGFRRLFDGGHQAHGKVWGESVKGPASSDAWLDHLAGERPQHHVPAGDWFAAELATNAPWSLMSCTVAPGFDFADFELAAPDQLTGHHAALTEICGDWRRFCAQR